MIQFIYPIISYELKQITFNFKNPSVAIKFYNASINVIHCKCICTNMEKNMIFSNICILFGMHLLNHIILESRGYSALGKRG